MPCLNRRRIVNRRYVNMPKSDYLSFCNRVFSADTAPDYYVYVPCGYCSYCQKKRSRDYSFRLINEFSRYKNSLFVTLTFDNSNLEKFRSDTNKAVRLFLDRCRKRYGKALRHWFVCEYGSLNGRPHYHGIIFNTPSLSDSIVSDLNSLWSYGFIYVGYVDERTCRYISKYVTKGASLGKRAPRVLSSPGIGLSYLDDSTISLHRRIDPDTGLFLNFYSLYGKSIPLPRYYSNYLYTVDERLYISYLVSRLPISLSLGSKIYCSNLEYDFNSRLQYLREIASGSSLPLPVKSYQFNEYLINLPYANTIETSCESW